MKNEDRIVELLSESLKKQDQMIEELTSVKQEVKGMNTRLDKHEEILGKVVKSLDNLTDVVIQAMREIKRLDALEQRIKRIEKHTGLD